MLYVRQLERVQDNPRRNGFESDTVHFSKLHQLLRSRNTTEYNKQTKTSHDMRATKVTTKGPGEIRKHGQDRF